MWNIENDQTTFYTITFMLFIQNNKKLYIIIPFFTDVTCNNNNGNRSLE